MNWLLKIAEGPMKGAEIALVGGTRVKVGASDACDIVVADATLGEVAFELDVTESGVTLIRPDGKVLPALAYVFMKAVSAGCQLLAARTVKNARWDEG